MSRSSHSTDPPQRLGLSHEEAVVWAAKRDLV